MSGAPEPHPTHRDISRNPPPDPWRWKPVAGADLATTVRTGKACFQFIFDYHTGLNPTPLERPTFRFLAEFFRAVSTGEDRPISSSELADTLRFLQAVRITEQTGLERKLKQKGGRHHSGTIDVLNILLTLVDGGSPQFQKEVNEILGFDDFASTSTQIGKDASETIYTYTLGDGTLLYFDRNLLELAKNNRKAIMTALSEIALQIFQLKNEFEDLSLPQQQKIKRDYDILNTRGSQEAINLPEEDVQIATYYADYLSQLSLADRLSRASMPENPS